MNRITIDTGELQVLASRFDAEAGSIAELRVGLLRATGSVPVGAYPGVESILASADQVTAELGQLAAEISEEAAAARQQVIRVEIEELLGASVAVLLAGLGTVLGAATTMPLAPWAPVPAPMVAAPLAATLNTSQVMPLTGPPAGFVDPLAMLGTQNGALAPISGLLGQVQSVVDNPLGVGGSDPLAALGAQNGALAPISGLLGQVQGVIDDPTDGISIGGLPPVHGLAGLQSLEQTVLNQRIGAIMNGAPFAGSTELGMVRNGLQALLPGGVNNFTANLVAQAKATGAFQPGANPGALLGVEQANAKFSSLVQNVNPFQGIIDSNKLQLASFNQSEMAFREGQIGQAQSVIDNANSLLAKNLP